MNCLFLGWTHWNLVTSTFFFVWLMFEPLIKVIIDKEGKQRVVSPCQRIHPPGQSLTKPKCPKMTVENKVRTSTARCVRTSYNPYKWPYKWVTWLIIMLSGQIIIFHQPRFTWNKGISLTKPQFGVRSCEVAIIWPNVITTYISGVKNPILIIIGRGPLCSD